jgi:hypothetical protein
LIVAGAAAFTRAGDGAWRELLWKKLAGDGKGAGEKEDFSRIDEAD